ncbi:hypothetical protein [Schinkia azotoformans]|uniref:hypothetical protein n=1 Tax=Schinkia azotoformans TaxID=1454 RepID=UPI003D281CA4
MGKIVSFIKDNKKAAVTSIATVGALAIATAAGAEGADTAVVTSVTDQMTTIKDTAIAILGSVAAVAILLFGGIYGWRYGKKVFAIISK